MMLIYSYLSLFPFADLVIETLAGLEMFQKMKVRDINISLPGPIPSYFILFHPFSSFFVLFLTSFLKRILIFFNLFNLIDFFNLFNFFNLF